MLIKTILKGLASALPGVFIERTEMVGPSFTKESFLGQPVLRPSLAALCSRLQGAPLEPQALQGLQGHVVSASWALPAHL